jgi:hypothetical protein
MSNSSLLPHGENLRRAIQWISDQGKHDLRSIEDASIRFDLTPQEELFLMRHFKIEPPVQPE